MLCINCLQNATNKLIADDIIILEYLNNQGATIPQCTMSRETIKEELKMTNHKCYSSISRLECLDMIERKVGTKSSRYFITKNGQHVLYLVNDKLQEVE
ncbi:gp137 [Bacillus phage G]|uniref:Gp137 n=1 Tax=Bacillus phage G TaxID=2884420 RepID=G3MBK3_9CAUD|nr:gp137 [Bacillus phage G]AEO93399.1 gp137 [Bacillus phage G]